MHGLTRRCWSNEAGVGAVEFALIAPFILIAMLGSFQVFALARARMLAVAATRNLADLVSQQASVTALEVVDYCKGAKLSLLPLNTTGFAASVASVSYVNTARKVDWINTSCGAVSAIANAASDAAPVTTTSGDSAIVVKASFRYASPLTFPLALDVTFSISALARPRSGTPVTYGS
ncbi:TadE/TadG family type IV pilus assembly protein [Methylobacterium sp. Leaf125]|jgi:Flp pilus assembly protein TadG|uniref:TadE/TadG family type IV pilus assembly protein n=1 Tax=Methylobacterium sp. Leaf125 TaxID=1736265 RepID=UPI000AFDE8DB|nr:TadE/TadG family type IV pilus assembly protein [Methylobacterium sp. Leaf125]